MTTIHTPTDAAASAASPGAGQALSAVASWVTTSDHKRIGRLFVSLSMLMSIGLIGLGAVLGFDRIDRTENFLDVNSLGQLFSLFRVGLIFMAMIPLMLGTAISIVPMQLGARSMTFPRAAALGLWTWLTGCGLVITAYAQNGGPGGGDSSAVDLFLAGLGLTVIGLVIAAASLASTVLTSRAPGMTLDRVPAFAWSSLVLAVAIIITLPVMLAALVYIYVDHRYGGRQSLEAGGFGGNAIYPWLRNALSQPLTFIYALPVLGFVAEVVPVFARRRTVLRFAVLVGVGIFATASLTGITQIDHTIGEWGSLSNGDRFKDLVDYAFFNLVPILGILVLMGAVTLTLLTGLKARTVRLEAPLIFGFAGVITLTHAVLAHLLVPIEDLHLAGSVYEEGVFTFVVYSVLLAGLGAVSYWAPKFRGRQIPRVPLLLLALGGLGASLLASVPYLISGFNNQPGLFGVTRAESMVIGWNHEAAPELLNTLTGIGHGLMALTLLGFIALTQRAYAKGKSAGDDPWNGQTLEWATSSPPPPNNFVDLASVASPEPLTDLKPAGSDA
jgi:hypothetical protein